VATLPVDAHNIRNQNSGTAGVIVRVVPFNLSNFAGQTVRIKFRATRGRYVAYLIPGR